MRIYPRGARGILWADFTVDGERVKRSSGTTERAAAEEWAATLARDLWRTRRLGEAPTVTWDQAVIAWLKEHDHLRSIEDVKLRLAWFTPHLQGATLASIDSNRIRDLAGKRKSVEVKLDTPTSNATVNRHLAEVSKILHYAHRRNWLKGVPPIAKMHEPAKRVTWITKGQARTLLTELPAHLRAMAAFSLATGLRESNVRLLCWQQVDLERGVAWIYADQAKAGKDLSIPLNEEALQVLDAQAGRHKRWVFPVPRWEKKESEDDEPRLVADAPTGKISNHAWRKACIRAGLPTLRFHDLRHTWASWHVQAGTPLPVLQELGGWASLAMVQRYAHLGRTHVAAWASNIGGTTAVQHRIMTTNENGPEGPLSQGENLGWLMGLEPTTTGITRRARRGAVMQINDLASLKKRKTG